MNKKHKKMEAAVRRDEALIDALKNMIKILEQSIEDIKKQ